MLRTIQLACHLSKAEADALNRESGLVYSRTLVLHYRVYSRKVIWLSASAQSRLEDVLGGSTILHAHSRDAAQQAFLTSIVYSFCARLYGQRRAKRITEKIVQELEAEPDATR